jgi:uncharacterized protein (TIGR02996 family)
MDKRTSIVNQIVRHPHDDAPRLEFAAWLEEHGDPHFANYIRARCALDGHPPAPAEYPALVEQYLEAQSGRREPDFELPPGFSPGCWWSGDSEQWWSDGNDALERGLLSFVEVEPDGAYEEAAKLLIQELPQLIRTTPVRGVNFGDHFAKQMLAILKSPGARHLKRIALDNQPRPKQASLAIQALAASPVARTLVRVEIGGGPAGTLSNADATALATAPFERLQRLDVQFTDCSRRVMEQLLTAPWFRRLHRLRIGLNEPCGLIGARLLAGMPNLHTLGLWMPPDSAVLGLGSAAEFPALRRLFIHCANLEQDRGAALGRMKAPGLIELWLRNCKVGKGDVPALAATALFDDLRVLTFDGAALNEDGLDAIAARPCAAKLRILRVQGSDSRANFRSLARTALTRPGAFPALTTLQLDSPYGRTMKRPDTAELLAKLASPNLRHLKLSYCNFDDACATALATNPAFAGLTRLTIGGKDATGHPAKLQSKTVRKLFQSENLRNLIELEMSSCRVGEAAEVLTDAAALPNLAKCSLSEVPEKVAEKLRKKRPVVYCWS